MHHHYYIAESSIDYIFTITIEFYAIFLFFYDLSSHPTISTKIIPFTISWKVDLAVMRSLSSCLFSKVLYIFISEGQLFQG